MKRFATIGLFALIGVACSSSNPSGSASDASGTAGGMDTGSSAPSRSASGEMEVSAPVRGTQVSSPLSVRGRARAFEGQVNFRLRTQGGQIIAMGGAQAKALEPGQFGAFEGTLSWEGKTAGTAAELEVFEIRPRDGAPDHVVSIPLLLK